MNRIEQLIEKYHLHPHPEGGHYAEVYTAPFMYEENRECAGSIYFMLVKNDISHFHVIDCDEIWYFHEGCGMKITMIDEKGNITSKDLGMGKRKKQWLSFLKVLCLRQRIYHKTLIHLYHVQQHHNFNIPDSV